MSKKDITIAKSSVLFSVFVIFFSIFYLLKSTICMLTYLTPGMSVKVKFYSHHFSFVTLMMMEEWIQVNKQGEKLFFAFYRVVGHSQDRRISYLGSVADYWTLRQS